MDSLTDERLVALETKLSFMEDYVNQLQAVSVEHTKLIDSLHEEVRLMAQKIKDMSDQLEGDVPSRRPPHY